MIAPELRPGPSLAGTPPVAEGEVAAIVCRGQSCSLPITDAEALRKELAGA